MQVFQRPSWGLPASGSTVVYSRDNLFVKNFTLKSKLIITLVIFVSMFFATFSCFLMYLFLFQRLFCEPSVFFSDLDYSSHLGHLTFLTNLTIFRGLFVVAVAGYSVACIRMSMCIDHIPGEACNEHCAERNQNIQFDL